VGENLCCVGILGWSENERMMDYGGRRKKVGEDEGVVLFFYFLENRMKESPLSEEGDSLNEGTLMMFVVSLLCSFPTSRRGIRLKTDVASCSFLLPPS